MNPSAWLELIWDNLVNIAAAVALHLCGTKPSMAMGMIMLDR